MYHTVVLSVITQEDCTDDQDTVSKKALTIAEMNKFPFEDRCKDSFFRLCWVFFFFFFLLAKPSSHSVKRHALKS